MATKATVNARGNELVAARPRPRTVTNTQDSSVNPLDGEVGYTKVGRMIRSRIASKNMPEQDVNPIRAAFHML